MFSRRPTALLRFAVCLLAVLQCVAVSWHVCELGGANANASHCQPAVQNDTALQCHPEDDPTRVWRFAIDTVPAPDGASHCLAALLSTTPAHTAQAFTHSSPFEARQLQRTVLQNHLCDAVTCCVDARGPPSA